MTKVDIDFVKKLPPIENIDMINQCYQCSACVGTCTASLYSQNIFNPRTILLKTLLGLQKELIKENSIIWECTTCYNCKERCPFEISPIDIITALKNVCFKNGFAPKQTQQAVDSIKKTGRVTQLSDAVNRIRKSLGLEEVKPIDMNDVRKIF